MSSKRTEPRKTVSTGEAVAIGATAAFCAGLLMMLFMAIIMSDESLEVSKARNHKYFSDRLTELTLEDGTRCLVVFDNMLGGGLECDFAGRR